MRKERTGVKGLSGRKYRNKKITVDGQTFDSRREAQRWSELRLLERAGEIHGLQRQVPFTLIPSQRRDGKVIERPCVYKADFVYTQQDGTEVVEDVKGLRVKEYIIKRKLMLWEYGIEIKEV